MEHVHSQEKETETILIADDNEDIREILRVLLESEGYAVLEAQDGQQALELLERQLQESKRPERPGRQVDLVILDVMMPRMSGLKACVELRKLTNAPVLFLTAKSMDNDKALGFSSGGDDYLVKPFSASELLYRVKALLRRYRVYRGKPSSESLEPQRNANSEADKPVTIFYHEFELNLLTETVRRNGRELSLTDIEFRILCLLVQNKGKIFSPQNLYESVWDEPYYYSANNTLMVHIRNLRKKIEPDPQNPKYLVTVWGKGYRCV